MKKEITRTGSFSSSQMSNLMSKGRGNFTLENIGKPFTTYVEEKIFERDLGRSLNADNNARPTSWGKLVEEYAFEKMDLNFQLVSKTRYQHKKHKSYWTGMPDVITDDLIGDIKCPWTMKSFCKLVQSLESPELLKENYPEYYWQLVSNSILCERKTAMLIIYCPYLEDLEDIRDLARDYLGDQNNRFAFINWSEDDELPYLIKGKKYNDINVMEFEVPETDKNILTMRVEMAIKELKK